MPPNNYFLEAWNKNFKQFKTLSPEELSARWLTTFKVRPTGSGEMKPFKEEVLVTPDGKVIEGTSATESAAKYSTEHPKSDSSENFLNDLLFGGIGIGRAFITNTALSTITGLQNILPKLSFSNTYTTGTGLAAAPKTGAIIADAALAAATTAPSVYDISINGLNWTNGVETALGMLPVFPNMFRKPIKFKYTSKPISDLQINIPYSTDGTYAPYSSSNINIVNPDGSINRLNLISAIILIRRKYPNFILSLKVPYNSSNGKTTLLQHLTDVVTSALSVPVPKGSSRADLVRGALVHDIGKLLDADGNVVNIINNSKHGIKSGLFIDIIIPEKYRLEFSNPLIKRGVELHMIANGDFPVFQDYSDLSNYTLALRAADVGRGMSANEIGLNYPHLLLYDKASPSPSIFKGTPELDLYAANLWLRANGYKTIGKNDNPIEYLTNVLMRHKSFYRGVRNPFVKNSKHLDDIRNILGINEILTNKSLPNNPENRLQISAENIPLYPTGSGRADLFKVVRKEGNLSKHISTGNSKIMGIDPEAKDALYVSYSPQMLETYSKTDRAQLPARINLPFIPYKQGESLMEFIHKNDFTAINATDFYHYPFKMNETKINRTNPMSFFRMVEIPYLEQTGRPFSSDYTKWATNKGRISFKDISPVEKVPYLLYDKKVKKLLSLIIKFTGDEKLAESVRIIDEDGMTYVPTKINKYIERLETYINEFTPKLKQYLDGLVSQYNKQMSKIDELEYYNADPAVLSDMKNKLHSLVEKMGSIRDSMKALVARKIAKEYKDDMYFYKNNKSKYRPIIDLSLSSKLEFLLESGVLPVWMYSDFNKTIGFGSNSKYGIGFGRGSRNKLAPAIGSPLLYFVGNKGEKLFDINKKYTPEEIEKLINLIRKSKFNNRDAGNIYYQEDPNYEISRKTFKLGGKLK